MHVASRVVSALVPRILAPILSNICISLALTHRWSVYSLVALPHDTCLFALSDRRGPAPSPLSLWGSTRWPFMYGNTRTCARESGRTTTSSSATSRGACCGVTGIWRCAFPLPASTTPTGGEPSRVEILHCILLAYDALHLALPNSPYLVASLYVRCISTSTFPV